MGFDRELVREASRLRIDAGNGAYENTITLLEAVLALDNNTEEQNQTSVCMKLPKRLTKLLHSTWLRSSLLFSLL